MKVAQEYFSYDLEELRDIPVRSVCEAYGLRPSRIKHMFYSPAGEKDGSLYLYETNGQNRFQDFGRNIGGDSIQLVGYICNLDWKDAVQEMGRTFGIQPKGREDKDFAYELTDRQWAKIGIFGDLATKNFDFSTKGPNAVKKNEAISKKYAMSMNELRKKNPGVYKSVLEKRAFSYMYACQQQYFHALSGEFLIMQSVGFDEYDKITKTGYEEVKKILDDIKGVEKILKQALKGTDLKYTSYPYDIDKDFQKIVSGDVCLEVGSVSSYDIGNIAKVNGLKLGETEISASTYDELQRLNFTFPYAAVQIKDRVKVTADEKQIVIFENMDKLLYYGLSIEELDGSTIDHKVKDAAERINGVKKNEKDIKAFDRE